MSDIAMNEIEHIKDDLKVAHKRIDEVKKDVKDNENKFENEFKEVRKEHMADIKGITTTIGTIKDDVSKAVIKSITKLLVYVFTVFGAAIIGLATFIVLNL